MSSGYHNSLAILLTIAATLTIVAGASGYDGHLGVPLLTTLPILAAGIMLDLKIHLKESFRYLAVFHIMLFIFMLTQTLQIKPVTGRFLIDEQVIDLYFTGAAIWIIAGIAAANKYFSFSSRMFYLAVCAIAFITANFIFMKYRVSDYKFMGHSPSLVGALIGAWMGYLVLIVYTGLCVGITLQKSKREKSADINPK